MHGRKRNALLPTADQLAATKSKLETYKKLSQVAIQQRLAHACTPDTFELNGKLVAANPDVYSLWNHRREMLITMEGNNAPSDVASLVGGELILTAAAIGKNPKSYPAWHHRKWIVQRYHVDAAGDAGPGPVDITAELTLCGKLLDADERNFHCWNYRMWLAATSGVPAQQELEFTGERIAKNFSNYSAWHRRSHLLLFVHGTSSSSPLPLSVARADMELIRRAVYTEPDDQSPWFYRAWLIAHLWKWVLLGPLGEAVSQAQASWSEALACEAVALLLADVAPLRELAALETGAKWPRVAIAHAIGLLQSQHAQWLVKSGAFVRNGVAIDENDVKGILGAAGHGTRQSDEERDPALGWDVAALYEALAGMDPRHAAYYAYQVSKLQFAQA